MNDREPLRDASVDALIDTAARQLLDVDPSASLRERVLARIHEPESRMRGWIWVAAPVAAAALIVVAILVSRPAVQQPMRTATDYTLAVERPRAVVGPPRPAPTRQVAESRGPAVDARRARAAVVEEPLPLADEGTLPALSSPHPLAVPAIAAGRSTPVGVMEVAPISVRPLEVDALDDRPRERH